MRLQEFENELEGASVTLNPRALPYRGFAPTPVRVNWETESEAAGTATPCRITTVTAWINAFIPQFIPGQTRVVGRAGQTALIPPLPVPGFDCFLTDQRTFSPLPGASSRMHSSLTFDLTTPSAPRIGQSHLTGWTHGVNCATGAVTCVRHAASSAMRFFNFRSAAAGNLLMMELAGAAANPCLFGAPDIDYRGTLALDFRGDPTRRRASFYFYGLVDGFPAFEMYVSVNGGAAVPVFAMPPTTPFGLIGPAKRAVRSRVPLVCPVGPLPEGETEAEFETELEFAAAELETGGLDEAEQFFGSLAKPLTWAARRFWSYWSRQLATAKLALSQQRYGCYCGPDNVCPTAINSLDRCCQAHDAAYTATGVGSTRGLDMWTLEGIKRTVSADEVLVRCSTAAINDGTPYGPAERLYQRGIVSIFSTRASAGRAAMALGL